MSKIVGFSYDLRHKNTIKNQKNPTKNILKKNTFNISKCSF